MTTNHHTALPISSSGSKPLMTGELFNDPLGELDSAITDLLAGTIGFTQLKYGDGGELTIATGAITVTNSYHNVDTEADAASDNLDTVNGMAVGDQCYIRANDTARDVVITHGVGNIKTVTGSSITLDDTEKIAYLFHNGTDVIAMELGVAAGSSAFVGARVGRVADYTLATGGGGSEVLFTSEDYDDDGFMTLNSTDFVIPSGFAGKYRVQGGAQFPANATGFRAIEIVLNGTGREAGNTVAAISGQAIDMTVAWEGEASVTNTFSLRLTQTSGGNLTIPLASIWFTIEKIGD